MTFFGCQTKSPKTIDINRDYSVPVISVEIKGKTVNMILDTGGAITIIDDNLANELDISILPFQKEISGYGGRKSLNFSSETIISVDSVIMIAPIYVSDIDYITQGSDVQGIIGIEHLSSAGAIINLETNKVTVK